MKKTEFDRTFYLKALIKRKHNGQDSDRDSKMRKVVFAHESFQETSTV